MLKSARGLDREFQTIILYYVRLVNGGMDKEKRGREKVGRVMNE